MTEMELDKLKCSLVRKSNDLIQKSRYELSKTQQNVIAFISTQVKPWDDDFTWYEFNISDFCRLFQIDDDSGGNYTALKKAIKDIADKSVWVKLDNGKQKLLRFIDEPEIAPRSGVVRIKLHQLMKPFYLNLQQNYTQYELGWTVKFKSKYSLRLYELIKSIHYNELVAYERIFDIEDLKMKMGAELYKEWKHFRERALEPAIEEINLHSDKHIEYETINKGRKVIQVKLKITTRDIVEALTARNEG
jgi:plasmid replication initiation protein